LREAIRLQALIKIFTTSSSIFIFNKKAGFYAGSFTNNTSNNLIKQLLVNYLSCLSSSGVLKINSATPMNTSFPGSFNECASNEYHIKYLLRLFHNTVNQKFENPIKKNEHLNAE